MPKQSLQAASKKAARQANINSLDNLGSSKTDYFNEDSLNDAEKVIGNFIQRVQSNIQSAGLIVTGKISDITMRKIENGVEIMAAEELIYQDKGVNGRDNKTINDGKGYTNKRPPVAPIIEWVKAKNIRAENSDKLKHGSDYEDGDSPFKEQTQESQITSIAYAIRENIFKNGQPATNVYTKEIPQLIEDLKESVADFSVRELFKDF